jgi:hypothetical protein
MEFTRYDFAEHKALLESAGFSNVVDITKAQSGLKSSESMIFATEEVIYANQFT